MTRFETRVHRVGRAARFSASFPSAGEALAAWQAWAPETDPRLTSVLQLGTGSATAIGQYLGSERRLAGLLGAAAARGRVGDHRQRRLRRAAGPLGQRAHDARARRSRPSRTTSRERLPGRVRDALLAELARGGGVAGLGTGMLILDAYGGVLNRPRARATAFVHRDERYSIQYLAYHDDGGAASRAWLRRMHAHRRPARLRRLPELHRPGPRGWRAYYGATSSASEVRADYDPDRRFRSPRGLAVDRVEDVDLDGHVASVSMPDVNARTRRPRISSTGA